MSLGLKSKGYINGCIKVSQINLFSLFCIIKHFSSHKANPHTSMTAHETQVIEFLMVIALL